MKLLGIIPARSGSKGIKDKNIRNLNGVPLMAYTIKAALNSKAFDNIMVSTDSERYVDIALEYGAEVPFLRTPQTATDEAATRDVIIEVLQMYEKVGKKFDAFMILQPTSPLRTAANICESISLYERKHAKAIISVCEVEHSPLWSNVLPKNRSLEGFIKVGENSPRQQLETFYRINGAIYLYDTNFYLKHKNTYCNGSYAYIMKRENSIDIDT